MGRGENTTESILFGEAPQRSRKVGLRVLATDDPAAFAEQMSVRYRHQIEMHLGDYAARKLATAYSRDSDDFWAELTPDRPFIFNGGPARPPLIAVFDVFDTETEEVERVVETASLEQLLELLERFERYEREQEQA
jgi:hypothetical protein